MEAELKDGIDTTAFAFRGYNVTNMGKTPELLAHPAVRAHHRAAPAQGRKSTPTSLKKPIDLVGCVRNHEPSTLDTYARDLVLIVTVQMAQLEILEKLFGVEFTKAKMSFGYSLGEAAALVASGVLSLESALWPILALAEDAAELGRDVLLGVLFSRGPAISYDVVEKLCVHITNEGKGTIGASSMLAPNAVLLLGQADTLSRFKAAMHDVFPDPVHLRINPHRWPPMHTPICRQRNIRDRAAVILEKVPGGFSIPHPPVVSCVTGDYSYNDYNARALMTDWVDTPQRLWDAVKLSLAADVHTVVHVGPEPNIILATYNRISSNVEAQLECALPFRLGAQGRFAGGALSAVAEPRVVERRHAVKGAVYRAHRSGRLAAGAERELTVHRDPSHKEIGHQRRARRNGVAIEVGDSRLRKHLVVDEKIPRAPAAVAHQNRVGCIGHDFRLATTRRWLRRLPASSGWQPWRSPCEATAHSRQFPNLQTRPPCRARTCSCRTSTSCRRCDS